MKQRLVPIVLSALAATVVACAETGGPTAAELALDGADRASGRDSGQQGGQHAVRGGVFRFSNNGQDTFYVAKPVAGALVEACFLSSIPADTGDTVQPPPPPPDTGDTIRPPVDSSRVDSVSVRWSALAVRGAAGDSSGGPPGGGQGGTCVGARDRTDGDGAFELEGLASGLYRVQVTLSGSKAIDRWTIVAVRDRDVNMGGFYFPPK